MNDDIHALIGAYALDAVTQAERAQFEGHLAACGHCRAELIELRETQAALGGAVPATPPPALRSAVLDGITTVRQLPPIVDRDDDEPAAGRLPRPSRAARRRDLQSGTRTHLRRWLAAAAAAAVLLVGGIAWHPWTGSEPATVSATQQVLHAPDAHRYVRHLEGATATVVFSPRLGRSVLTTANLSPAPAGHTYQAWYLTPAGKATSAGLVEPSRSGHSVTLLDGRADDTALIGVTVEPAGGSRQPTTKPIMTVNLASA